MLRNCTRQFTRLRPRLAAPTTLARCSIPLSVQLQQRRNYCPRYSREDLKAAQRQALKELHQGKQGGEPESPEPPEEDIRAYVTPDDVAARILAHAQQHWPANPTPPQGWSTDFNDWALINTLFAPSPLPLMLPQFTLILLRHGIPAWDGLTPDLGDVIPPNTGVEMYSDTDIIVQLRGERYRFVLQDTLQVLRLTSPDTLDGMVVPEDPDGVSLFMRIMERDDKVRQDLYDQGYLPFVPEATTYEEEQASLRPVEDAQPDEASSSPEDTLHLKSQIDEMMREFGVEPPEDPEKWDEAFATVADKVKDSIGGDDGLAKLTKEIDDLMKLVDSQNDEKAVKEIDRMIGELKPQK